MRNSCKSIVKTALLITAISHTAMTSAQMSNLFDEGKAAGNFNLRYETVDQDNVLDDAQV